MNSCGMQNLGKRKDISLASGRVHNKINNIALILVISAVVYYICVIDFDLNLLYTIIGAYFAYYIDPDMLDQHQVITYGEYRIKRHFGKLIFIIVYLYLWPIARILPHRSILSHYPPINTIVRVIYFCLPVYLFISYYYGIEILSEAKVKCLVYIIIGGIPVDFGHLLLDKIPIFKESKR